MLNKIIFLTIFFLNSCSLFETREPESPIAGGGIFVPPTTPQIVIENLIEAFNNKNPDNYCNCFSAEKYVFSPSADVITSYPSLFSNWQIENERQYIIANFAELEIESNPHLAFTMSDFDFISSDSAIFVTNYKISCPLKNHDVSNNYSGTLILTITPAKAGTWAISKLQDFKNEDEETQSWSQLKAYFF